ncbi:MAG: hypothetical protein RKO25_15520 [Candidatus Contendobacter sp.]|nr:hypothetical protein [Candidatus Contendobacter sp.]
MRRAHPEKTLTSALTAVRETAVNYPVMYALGPLVVGSSALHPPDSGALRWAGILMTPILRCSRAACTPQA